MAKRLMVVFLMLYSGNVLACMGMVLGREESIEWKAWAVFIFFLVLGILSLIGLFENWRNAWRFVLVLYAIFSFPLKAPIVLMMDCSVWKEDVTGSLFAMGVILMVFEIQSISLLIKRIRKARERS